MMHYDELLILNCCLDDVIMYDIMLFRTYDDYYVSIEFLCGYNCEKFKIRKV